MRIWLHEGHDGEPGVEAWAPDWLGLSRRFEPWATWRTIRATLAHIADAETHYYLRNLGCEPEGPQVDPSGDWRAAHERQHQKSSARIARAFAANARDATP